MKYLVTGCAGFIGSHLCEALVKQGNYVVCLDNLLTGVYNNILHLFTTPNIEFHQEDAEEGVKYKVDGIFHLASPAAPEESTKYGKETIQVNSVATEKLLNTGRKVLFASSMKVYGECSRVAAYIVGKKEGERLCSLNKYAKVARMASVYGERMKPTDSRVVPVFINKAIRNEPLSVWNGGEQTDSFCYVDDMVEGLIRFMESSATGLIEFGSPGEIKIIDLAKLIIKLTGSQSEILTHERIEVVNVCHLVPDISDAKKLFRWYPTTGIEEGLTKTIREDYGR